MKYCLCGCGKEIILKRHHKRLGIPDYIWGHHAKFNNCDKSNAVSIY